ncbi:MAG TPA: hypothetical protein VG013_02395 [Gemmataceae bacterium]|jgi:hypothetical protein|nr:hypothetical protein [Gemmataceae bacterium]
MAGLSPSALATDQGLRVHLRIQGRLYELSQEELRILPGLPPGPPGLGITIDRNRFRFEFVADNQTRQLSTKQLLRRLAKQLTSGT